MITTNNLANALSEVDSRQYYRDQVSQFRHKAHIQIECGPYRIETVTSPEDLWRVLELRQHSFVSEFKPDVDADWVDYDRYDLLADHVVVKHIDTKEIIGAYRILCSQFTEQFYSQEQYNIGQLLQVPGVKIELGRAVIHQDHRNGVVLSMVWKGLARYAQAVQAQYLFGCASVRTVSPELAQSIYWHLYPMNCDNTYNIQVLPKYHCPEPSNFDDLPSWREIENQIPALLKTYIMAGAKICSRPALDQFFKCVDFFTVLDLEKINEKFKRRYFEVQS